MRTSSIYVAAGIALCSSVSMQALPAFADDGQLITSRYSSGRTYFSAQQGADYILYAYGNGTVSIINPTSGPSPVLSPTNDNELEAQFRATYTASYGLDAQGSYYDYAYGAVYTDCRDDVKTSCQLTASRSQHGSILTRGDRDWYRVSLRKGQRYQFALTASQQVTLTLRNPKGSLITRSLNGTNGGTAYVNYKAPATGTYFAAARVVSYGT